MTDTTQAPEENVRYVPIPAPVQFGALPMPNQPASDKRPVVIIAGQMGWKTELVFDQNAALDFARRIRQAVKDARSGLVKPQAAILGANGQAISVPTPVDEDEDE